MYFNKLYIIIIMTIIILILYIGCQAYIERENKKLELERYRKKIFAIRLEDIAIDNIEKDTNYKRIMKALNKLDRKPSKEELEFTFRLNRFLHRDDVYSMADDKDIELMTKVMKEIIKDNVEGDIVEFGCWRGGMISYIRAILKVYEKNSNRKVYGFDTFSHFPLTELKIEAKELEKDRKIHDLIKIIYDNYHSAEQVKKNIKKFDLWDDNINLIEGNIISTIYTPINKIALLRIDTDSFDSVANILQIKYFKIVRDGFIVIDDYNNPLVGCKDAVDAFRRKHNISEPIISNGGNGIYWRVK